MRTRPAGLGRRAHPRSRGENSRSSRMLVSWSGSSPLTRGKRGDSLDWVCAGWAHPRSRGENGGGWWDVQLGRGSSPLTRGKPDSPAAPPSRGGLIPAHAGKTTYRAGVQLTARAHPRSRGENRWCSLLVCSYSGSSPLTRGKPAGPPRPASKPGLIPAHAGKTV